MMTNEPERFEVWRLAFAYEDQPDVTKERPAVIGVIDRQRQNALVVKVTSHGPRLEFPGEIRLRDWKEAGLLKPSTVRCSKTMLVPLEAFANARCYGRLSRRDAMVVDGALRSLGYLV